MGTTSQYSRLHPHPRPVCSPGHHSQFSQRTFNPLVSRALSKFPCISLNLYSSSSPTRQMTDLPQIPGSAAQHSEETPGVPAAATGPAHPQATPPAAPVEDIANPANHLCGPKVFTPTAQSPNTVNNSPALYPVTFRPARTAPSKFQTTKLAHSINNPSSLPTGGSGSSWVQVSCVKKCDWASFSF